MIPLLASSTRDCLYIYIYYIPPVDFVDHVFVFDSASMLFDFSFFFDSRCGTSHELIMPEMWSNTQVRTRSRVLNQTAGKGGSHRSCWRGKPGSWLTQDSYQSATAGRLPRWRGGRLAVSTPSDNRNPRLAPPPPIWRHHPFLPLFKWATPVGPHHSPWSPF